MIFLVILSIRVCGPWWKNITVHTYLFSY